MITDQLLLFPELDPFKTIIKNIDYVDVSTINPELQQKYRTNPYSTLPKNKFFIFRTGGFNKFRPSLGNIFPYLKNMETGKIMGVNLFRTYLRTSITFMHPSLKKYTNIEFRIHRLAAEAFIVNDDPKKKLIVDHINNDRLDYSLKNLRWCSYRDNNLGCIKKRGINLEERNSKKV